MFECFQLKFFRTAPLIKRSGICKAIKQCDHHHHRGFHYNSTELSPGRKINLTIKLLHSALSTCYPARRPLLEKPAVHLYWWAGPASCFSQFWHGVPIKQLPVFCQMHNTVVTAFWHKPPVCQSSKPAQIVCYVCFHTCVCVCVCVCVCIQTLNHSTQLMVTQNGPAAHWIQLQVEGAAALKLI